MGIRVEHVRGPAFLASALVNGDTSSFDDAGKDAALLKSFLEWVAPGRVVSIHSGEDTEAYFATLYIAGVPFTGDVLTYVVHYEEG